MRLFRADMHIHTVLSPCGGLEMTPERIVDEALAKGMDLIAVTDHNSTLQCREVIEVGRERGLLVIGGTEVNTREEVHCIALFENDEMLGAFQDYLNQWLPDIPNNPRFFGHQVWVNRNEEIMGEEPRLLWSALDQSIDQVADKVASLNGLFFPAHIDRPNNGILRQLGFIPGDLKIDAVEIIRYEETVVPQLKEIKEKYSVISNSDAHSPEQIGQRFTSLMMEDLSFKELRLALRNESGRNSRCGGRL